MGFDQDDMPRRIGSHAAGVVPTLRVIDTLAAFIALIFEEVHGLLERVENVFIDHVRPS